MLFCDNFAREDLMRSLFINIFLEQSSVSPFSSFPLNFGRYSWATASTSLYRTLDI